MNSPKLDLVCVTPAGRRRYMRYLVPQVILSNDVDRYDIWVNTINKGDLRFLELLEKKYPKVNLVEQPEGKVNGTLSINAFFTKAMNENEIYSRMDDDIVWIEPGFFKRIKEIRIANPEPFLITPLVINNAICTHLLQREGIFKHPKYIPAHCLDETAWEDPKFAYELHEWFIEKIMNNSYDDVRCKDKLIALNRFSINSICWLGKTVKSFDGKVLGDEEEFMSVVKPSDLGLANKIIGDLLVAHYAFFPQRDYLDKTNLLDSYELAIRHTYKDNKELNDLLDEVYQIYLEAGKGAEEPKKFFYNDYKTFRKKVGSLKLPVVKFESVKTIFTNQN